MADFDSVRQRIVASVFARRNTPGAEETYVSHVKVWEDAGPEGGGRKPRYIILSEVTNGIGFIHKSKLNANGSFSIGKTWRLDELRGVEVVEPLAFNITLARTSRWQTEHEEEQANFVFNLIRTFRRITGGATHLHIVGIRDPDGPQVSQQQQQPAFVRMERAPTPPNGAPIPTSTRRPQLNGAAPANHPSRQSHFSTRSSSPTLVPPTPRAPSRSKRAGSPARQDSSDSHHLHTPSDHPPPRNRPTTPQQPPPTPRQRQGRRPSNASSTARSSAATFSSQIPSVLIPSSPARPSILSPSSTVPSNQNRMNGSSVTPTVSLEIPSLSASSSLMQPSPLSAYQQTPDTPRPRPISPAQSTKSTVSKPPEIVMESLTSMQPRREQNARVSFYDPVNQTILDRLLSGDSVLPLEKDVEGEGVQEGGEVELESTQATLTSVEEMVDGYDMLDPVSGRGTADQIEARLLDELLALDKANIHSFIESDDRVNTVLQFLEDALNELDTMDSIVSSYKIHLNAVNDDIAYIQGQDRGLQVQTQNQRALLKEIEELLQTVQVDSEALLTLAQESLEKSASIARMEEASSQLYKALLAGRDRDMAATMERLDEYRTHNAQFCKRIFDFLSIMFIAQSKLLLSDNNGIVKPARGKPSIKDHREYETYLGRYGGLMLYLKEMDEGVYGRLCGAYFSAASALHSAQMKAFLVACASLIKKSDADEDEGFSITTPTSNTYRVAAVGMRRAGTIVRSPLEARREKKDKEAGELRSSEAFGIVLERITPMVYQEEDFIADFLQVNDAALTFADYMGLENYFRRQAARTLVLSPATTKLIRGAMDLIFGFLPAELKSWLDDAVQKDQFEIVGIVGGLERFLTEAEERGNTFFYNVLEKQHARLRTVFDRRVAENVKLIEETKLTSRRRNGVAPFIKYFPTYVGKIEPQLIGADTLEIRQHVDQAYDKIVVAMFEALKHMAKLDDGGEDKGQLNYHVIMIENMHYFSSEISQLTIGSVASFIEKARGIYDENLSSYCKLVLRRPFARIIDYFEGIERLLQTTAPSEVANNATYSKGALKKIVKENSAKELRKHIDTLFKRVEKHYTDLSTLDEMSTSTQAATSNVLSGVWKACEEELLRITELFQKRINQCYAGSGIALEYNAGDVEAAFKKHKT